VEPAPVVGILHPSLILVGPRKRERTCVKEGSKKSVTALKKKALDIETLEMQHHRGFLKIGK